MGGRCPDDSEFRCKAKRRSGERCARWAVRDSDYCPFHGGRTRKKIKVNVPRFYSKHLTKTLKKALERSLKQAPSRQLSLFEELALMRDAAGQTVALYSGALESGNTELITAATMLMRDALNDVRTMCESASRIAAASDAVMPIHNMVFIVQQVTKIIYNVLGDEGQEQAEAIAQALNNELLIDTGAPTGVTLTPESDVADMIDTVPRHER